MRILRIVIVLTVVMSVFYASDVYSQQDIQFTQYMYNPMSINPGYSGSLGHGVITTLGRTQWVGFDGAPDSQTLSYHTPLRNEKIGIGVNLTYDRIGPSSEAYLDVNPSYILNLLNQRKLAFGLKLGGRLLNVDFNKGKIASRDDSSYVYSRPETRFSNIQNNFLPTVGAGVFYYTPNMYIGFSVPNFILKSHSTKKLDNLKESAVERPHFFITTGYVINLSEGTKFKPASLFKFVSGSRPILDVSGNFLFGETVTLGLAWRWDDSASALIGFQVTNKFYLGYSYDVTTTTKYKNTNTGSHEILLRFELLERVYGIKSPRFF